MIDLTFLDITDDLKRELLESAVQATSHSYSPYSKFRVGAAIRFTDNHIFSGCNIENASYSLTICAERVALFKGVYAGSNRIDQLAIAVDDPAVPYPCGACLQVLSEFGEDFPVYLINSEATLHTFTFKELLPHRFTFYSHNK